MFICRNSTLEESTEIAWMKHDRVLCKSVDWPIWLKDPDGRSDHETPEPLPVITCSQVKSVLFAPCAGMNINEYQNAVSIIDNISARRTEAICEPLWLSWCPSWTELFMQEELRGFSNQTILFLMQMVSASTVFRFKHYEASPCDDKLQPDFLSFESTCKSWLNFDHVWKSRYTIEAGMTSGLDHWEFLVPSFFGDLYSAAMLSKSEPYTFQDMDWRCTRDMCPFAIHILIAKCCSAATKQIFWHVWSQNA